MVSRPPQSQDPVLFDGSINLPEVIEAQIARNVYA